MNLGKEEEMKKKNLIGLLAIAICITLVGCSKNGNDIAVSELKEANNKIIEYFSSNNIEYDNMGFNYIDKTNQTVVVGLINNSIDQQEKFKKLVVDSELITFVQGEDVNHYNSIGD